MQWWNDFTNWLYSDAGWRVVSTVVVPFVAIILAAVIAALIARGTAHRILAREDRDDRAAAVATFIEVGRQSTQWANIPASNQVHLDALESAASVRLRLLPSHGASAAAEWAEHQVQKIKDNSATFSVQSEQDYVEFRDRLTEWQHKPKAARRLFAADLVEFKAADTAVDEELVERQRQWAAEQAAAEQLAAERAAADAAAAAALEHAAAANAAPAATAAAPLADVAPHVEASAFTGPIATPDTSDAPAPRLRSNFEAPEPTSSDAVHTGAEPAPDEHTAGNVDDAPATIFETDRSNDSEWAAATSAPAQSAPAQADPAADFEEGFRARATSSFAPEGDVASNETAGSDHTDAPHAHDDSDANGADDSREAPNNEATATSSDTSWPQWDDQAASRENDEQAPSGEHDDEASDGNEPHGEAQPNESRFDTASPETGSTAQHPDWASQLHEESAHVEDAPAGDIPPLQEPEPAAGYGDVPPVHFEPTGPITIVDPANEEVVEATIDEENKSPFARPRFYDS